MAEQKTVELFKDGERIVVGIGTVGEERNRAAGFTESSTDPVKPNQSQKVDDDAEHEKAAAAAVAAAQLESDEAEAAASSGGSGRRRR
tara:strand:- start:902 stop:1165 length:264 start_codon:yes stop_codon:yes gene_type:complete